MNVPTVKKYKSYTSPNSSPKSKWKEKLSDSIRRTSAARKIQHTFRTKRFEECPATTRPSVQQMMNNIFSMKDLNVLRRNQERRATDPMGFSHAQYHLGATGSW
jgi:hypothetical protein